MINAKIAYELGISAATVNAVGKRILGVRVPHWTLSDVQLIVEYIKSISVEEDGKRLAALHNVVQDIMGGKTLDDCETRERMNKDIHCRKK